MSVAEYRAPSARVGAWAWVRGRLFAGPVDAAITLVCLWFLWRMLSLLLDWAVFDASWSGQGREDCRPGGACWVFVRARFGQFIYGLYPEDQRWRVDLAAILLVGGLIPLLVSRLPGRRGLAIAAVIAVPIVDLWLLVGGVGGLSYVETREWGGLLVTVFMSVYGALIAFPLGVGLALGRRSTLPVIRTLSVVFIEFWRGVPIISVIFLASILLPLIMPEGVTVDKLLRALIGLAMVVAAYIAEVVRGGLQAIPVGQYEAARALGLGYWRMTGLVILPQALRLVIPSLVNEFIALVKNTTLVLIVSLFDLLGMAHAALADPKWVGLTLEAYGFAGLVFWLLCFAMSRYSRHLERRLGRADARRSA